MTPLPAVLEPDPLNRRVLIAVELRDPVTDDILSKGFKVSAPGLSGTPRMSASGRFVWLIEKDRWPTSIVVVPDDLRYLPATVVPPRPPDVTKVAPNDRLVSIRLRAAAAYDVDAGVTAIRGRLVESAGNPVAVAGARVQLALQVAGAWVPPPPASAVAAATTPAEPQTDAQGQFLAFARTPFYDPEAKPPVGSPQDPERGCIQVRLQCTRETPFRQTRVTATNYPFLPDPTLAGRVPEGQLLRGDVTLRWMELVQP